MPVYGCSTCSRMISSSILPGGNPIAKTDPERWAQSWVFCPQCPTLVCERCASPDMLYCPRCYAALEVPTQEVLFEMYFGSKPPPDDDEASNENKPEG